MRHPFQGLVLAVAAAGSAAPEAAGQDFTGPQFPVGANPETVVVADLDGDNRVDCASVDFTSGTLTMLFGDGTGGVKNTASLPVAPKLTYGAAGDLDNDGDSDLLATTNNGFVHVLTANGGGTFAPAVGYSIGLGTQAIVLGDWNADGALDVATANATSDDVSILVGTGAGTLLTAVPIPTGHRPNSIAAHDLDGDGDLDLVTANYGSNDGTALFANGAGGFPSRSVLATGSRPTSVAVAELSQDVWPDLVFANYNTGSVSVSLGSGGGVFTAPAAYPSNSASIAVACGDIDSDGYVDIACANFYGIFNGSLTTLRGTGAGAFASASTFPAGINPGSIVLVDFDSDARLDYIVSNYAQDSVSWIRGDGKGSADGYTRIPTTGISASLDACDLDSDGNADLAAIETSGKLTAYLGDGAGGFVPGPVVAVAATSAVRVADVNGDGVPDLLAAGFSDKLEILIGNGTGGFQPPASHTVVAGAQTTDVVAGDWNLDGGLDVAVSVPGLHLVMTMVDNGSGAFVPSAAAPIGFDPQRLATADVNNDGSLDIATVSNSCSCATVVLGMGTGFFGGPIHLSMASSAWGLDLGDLSGDGNADLATAMQGVGKVQIFYGNGAGSFLNGPALAGATQPVDVRIGDLDHNGFADLVAGDNLGRGLAEWRNDGTGVFTTGIRHGTGIVPSGLCVCDFDADGQLDAAYAGGNPNGIVVLTSLRGPAVSTQLFGTGTAGCAGRLGMSASSTPNLGNAGFALAATNAAPDSLGILVIGNAADLGGSDSLGVGILLHVDVLLSTELLALDMWSASAGVARAAAPIPNNPLLVGAKYTAQAMFLEPALAACDPSPLSLVSSKGISIVVVP